MDDELKLAGVWNDEIEGRIGECDLFLLLLSKATEAGDANRFFRKEWTLAHRAQRRFLPIRLEECRLPSSLPSDLVSLIESRQREDLFPSYEDGLRRILRFLHTEKRTGVFEETFSCLGPDNPGWRLGPWQLDPSDSTGENSCSIHAVAALSPATLLPQTARHTASVEIDLPGRPLQFRYRRQFRLSAPVGGEAALRVSIDGEVVDTASHSDPGEAEWTTRSVPVPDRGARRAMLDVTVLTSSTLNYFPSAEAWIDDLRIA
jgi:TIR domain